MRAGPGLATAIRHCGRRSGFFFELYVHAVRGRPGTEGFLERVVTGWLEPLTAAEAFELFLQLGAAVVTEGGTR
jgi:hypothetical protein